MGWREWWGVAAVSGCLLLLTLPLRWDAGEGTNAGERLLAAQFRAYVEAHNKSYREDPLEYRRRFTHYKESIAEIDRLNAASRGPDDQRARFGPTRLSDMSKAEFAEIHLSDEKPLQRSHHHRHHENHGHSNEVYNVSRRKRAIGAIPTKIDWRERGYVGAIQNQGICGACWAFTTVGTIESMAAIKTGKFTPLSVQETIDCAGYGNKGCAGGDICLLLDWLQLTGTVLVTENSYPLSGLEGTCRLRKNITGVTVAGSTCDSKVGVEDQIISLLATHGPVAVAVNALTWQNYLGGVIQYHCSGGMEELNHAVQLVGYDLTGEIPHYIARNSWGREFGDDGYLRLAVGGNICGLANEVAAIDVAV